MRLPTTRILLFVALWSAPLGAQRMVLSNEARADFASIRDYVTRAAEKMPAAKYDYRPVPEVRTFGQIIAHVADDQFNLCAPVKGETRHDAYSQIEHTITTKAALVDTLKKAFAYCDAAYAPIADATAAEAVHMGKSTRSRLAMLQWNVWHTWEHYGNLVTYLRINHIVPPSSEPTKSAAAAK